MATGAGAQSHLGKHKSIDSLKSPTERSLPSVFLPDNHSCTIGLFALLDSLVGMHKQSQATINSDVAPGVRPYRLPAFYN